MNHVERFRAVMNFQPVDRLPRWEWAMWWDETIRRWHHEGLPVELKFSQVFDIAQHFGLDPYQQFWFSTTDPTIEATQHHVEGIVANMDDYLRVRPQLFPRHDAAIAGMAAWAERQRRGEAVVWCTLEGFFWFPRTLMGFEKLMFAFADQPELLHEINRDLLAFNLGLLDKILEVCVPTFMTIAEDMSYNHGPMISKGTFEEFIAPYYRQLVPRLLERAGHAVRGYGRGRDFAGAVDGRAGRQRRAAIGAPGGGGRDAAARAIPASANGRALRQDDHEPRRGRHARRI